MTQIGKKNRYRILGGLLLLLCFILNFYYRPYAYSNHLHDFYLADCYTNLLGVPIGVCFIKGFQQKRKQMTIPQCILTILVSLISYEAIDAIFAKHLDFVDIIATCLSSIFIYIIYYYFKHIVG